LINPKVRTDKTGAIKSLRSTYVAAIMLEISISSCNLRGFFAKSILSFQVSIELGRWRGGKTEAMDKNWQISFYDIKIHAGFFHCSEIILEFSLNTKIGQKMASDFVTT